MSNNQQPIPGYMQAAIGAVSGAITMSLIFIWGGDFGTTACWGIIGGVGGAIGAIIARPLVQRWFPIITNPRIVSVLGGVLGGFGPFLCYCFLFGSCMACWVGNDYFVSVGYCNPDRWAKWCGGCESRIECIQTRFGVGRKL